MARVAFLLDRMDEAAAVSPFFAKARWLMVFDETSFTAAWTLNRGRNGADLCGLVLSEQVGVLVCGWIDARSCRYLNRNGVDVRLAPCRENALSWLGRVQSLPAARPQPVLKVVK